MQYSFTTKHEIAALMGYSSHTIKSLRRRKDWLAGIHYICVNSRVIRYNRELCLDWLIHKNEPHLHQQAIDAYLASSELDSSLNKQ